MSVLLWSAGDKQAVDRGACAKVGGETGDGDNRVKDDLGETNGSVATAGSSARSTTLYDLTTKHIHHSKSR